MLIILKLGVCWLVRIFSKKAKKADTARKSFSAPYSAKCNKRAESKSISEEEPTVYLFKQDNSHRSVDNCW